MEDQIAVAIDLGRSLIQILQLCHHSETTKMLFEAKLFWWPEMGKDIEQKLKDCSACLARGKNLKDQFQKNQYENYKN